MRCAENSSKTYQQQLTNLFYEKSNFVPTTIKKDYWAKGFDLYEMVLKD